MAVGEGESIDSVECLGFQNKFVEVVEELRLKRKLVEDNDNEIRSLQEEKYDLERSMEEQKKRHQQEKETLEQDTLKLKKAMEDKVFKVKDDKVKQTLTIKTLNNEIKALKDEARLLHVEKLSLEKKNQELEGRLRLFNTFQETAMHQLNDVHLRSNQLSHLCQELAEAQNELKENVTQASFLNGRLQQSNDQLTDVIIKLKQKILSLRNEVVSLNTQLSMISINKSSVAPKPQMKSLPETRETQEYLELKELLVQSRNENKKTLKNLAEASKLIKHYITRVEEIEKARESALGQVTQIQTELNNMKEKYEDTTANLKTTEDEYASAVRLWREKEMMQEETVDIAIQTDSATYLNSCNAGIQTDFNLFTESHFNSSERIQTEIDSCDAECQLRISDSDILNDMTNVKLHADLLPPAEQTELSENIGIQNNNPFKTSLGEDKLDSRKEINSEESRGHEFKQMEEQNMNRKQLEIDEHDKDLCKNNLKPQSVECNSINGHALQNSCLNKRKSTYAEAEESSNKDLEKILSYAPLVKELTSYKTKMSEEEKNTQPVLSSISYNTDYSEENFQHKSKTNATQGNVIEKQGCVIDSSRSVYRSSSDGSFNFKEGSNFPLVYGHTNQNIAKDFVCSSAGSIEMEALKLIDDKSCNQSGGGCIISTYLNLSCGSVKRKSEIDPLLGMIIPIPAVNEEWPSKLEECKVFGLSQKGTHEDQLNNIDDSENAPVSSLSQNAAFGLLNNNNKSTENDHIYNAKCGMYLFSTLPKSEENYSSKMLKYCESLKAHCNSKRRKDSLTGMNPLAISVASSGICKSGLNEQVTNFSANFNMLNSKRVSLSSSDETSPSENSSILPLGTDNLKNCDIAGSSKFKNITTAVLSNCKSIGHNSATNKHKIENLSYRDSSTIMKNVAAISEPAVNKNTAPEIKSQVSCIAVEHSAMIPSVTATHSSNVNKISTNQLHNFNIQANAKNMQLNTCLDDPLTKQMDGYSLKALDSLNLFRSTDIQVDGKSDTQINCKEQREELKLLGPDESPVLQKNASDSEGTEILGNSIKPGNVEKDSTTSNTDFNTSWNSQGPPQKIQKLC